MSSADQVLHDEYATQGPSSEEFLNYCTAERERRKNSGEPFDEAQFEQAMQMVLAKLRVLADEGWT
jgi:hypothetical protein